jgi:hypothetical protein
MSTQFAEFLSGVADLVESLGADEQSWFAEWRADFEEAQREGDDGTMTLLLDALVAFDAWLCRVHVVGARL